MIIDTEIMNCGNCRYWAKERGRYLAAPVNQSGTGEFIKHGLIEIAETVSGYKTTDKGAAHVDALCNLPIPEIKWVTPNHAGES